MLTVRVGKFVKIVLPALVVKSVVETVSQDVLMAIVMKKQPVQSAIDAPNAASAVLKTTVIKSVIVMVK